MFFCSCILFEFQISHFRMKINPPVFVFIKMYHLYFTLKLAWLSKGKVKMLAWHEVQTKSTTCNVPPSAGMKKKHKNWLAILPKMKMTPTLKKNIGEGFYEISFSFFAQNSPEVNFFIFFLSRPCLQLFGQPNPQGPFQVVANWRSLTTYRCQKCYLQSQFGQSERKCGPGKEIFRSG